jgi:hypothetical protein
MYRRIALRALGSIPAVGLVLAAGAPRAVAEPEPAGDVVGSWLIRSGTADRPLPITSLISYTNAGTCIQTTVSHPHRSPAVGVWTHLGGREFAVTFHAFAFDDTGHFTNVSQVRVQSVLDESLDGYTGRFESYTLDEDGNTIRLDGSGLVAATRIRLARLDSLDSHATS